MLNVDNDSLLKILSRTDPETVCRFSRTCKRAKEFVDANCNYLPRPVIKIILLWGQFDVAWERVDKFAKIGSEQQRRSLTFSGLIESRSLLRVREALKYAHFEEIILHGAEVKPSAEVVYVENFLDDLKSLGATTFILQYAFFTTKLKSNIDVQSLFSFLELYESIIDFTKYRRLTECIDIYLLYIQSHANNSILSVCMKSYFAYDNMEGVLQFIVKLIKTLNGVNRSLIKVVLIFDGLAKHYSINRYLNEKLNIVVNAELCRQLEAISDKEYLVYAQNGHNFKLSFCNSIEFGLMKIIFEVI